MTNEDFKIVITDLDGTLLNNQKEVSLTDMKSLFWLGENNIVRVVATGRNFFSSLKSLKTSFPIDYLIFSSGAGIFDWKKKKLIHSQFLPEIEVKQISQILIDHKVDFMIHELVPDNHKFLFHRTENKNPDFERRIEVYKDFAAELNPSTEKFDHASQILAVFPNNLNLFEDIKNKFKDIKIIRTTSPLDGDSIWMEIFPETVSKGHGIEWLCRKLNIDQSKTISVGNDYNDIDMLEYTAEKFVVSNAPADLKERFPVCNSNQQNGFTSALDLHFDFI